MNYYQKNRERLKAYGKAHYLKHREKRLRDAAAYRRARPDVQRKSHLGKYGITTDEYDRLFVAQGGVCAVCFEKETTKRKGVVRRLSVDHDHDTGKVRGLLCSWCNLAIGYLRDDALRAHSAVVYLESRR